MRGQEGTKMLERGGGGKKTQRAAWREEGARAEGGDGNTRKTSSGRDMGEERPRGNGEKIRERWSHGRLARSWGERTSRGRCSRCSRSGCLGSQWRAEWG